MDSDTLVVIGVDDGKVVKTISGEISTADR
jgi:hypothetical protein